MISHCPVSSFTQRSPRPCKRLTNHDLAQNQDASLVGSPAVICLNSSETSGVTVEINQTQYQVQCECKSIIFLCLLAHLEKETYFQSSFRLFKIVFHPIRWIFFSVQQEMRSKGENFSQSQLSIGSLSRRSDSPSGSGKIKSMSFTLLTF